jgi:hypothetical protein
MLGGARWRESAVGEGCAGVDAVGGKKTFAHNGKPNRHGLHDTGAAKCAAGGAGAAMGLQIHQMGGF